jgi:sugar/nucleoside kinase (ribokinase family)
VAYFEPGAPTGGAVRTGRVVVGPEERAPAFGGDPTGCGDVLGATAAALLIDGAPLERALRQAVRMAARNVTHRGATGLRDHLLGRLSTA